MQLGIGKSVVIDLPRDIKDVLVAEPKFANAVVRSTRRAYLIGVAVGQTNIYFFDAEGKQIAGFDIAVKRDLNGVRAMLQKLLPHSDVRVDGVGDGVMLSGSVANAANRSLGVDEELQVERQLRGTSPGGGRNSEANFHGRKRSNETHASTTDPDAKLYRKGPGKEAKLCFMGHGLMENRFGLLVGTCLTPANGHAERVAALAMIEPHADRAQVITLGADKAYDAEDFVNELRSMRVTPHVAQNTSGRRSAIDGRTTRHGGYALSQQIRKRIEEAFGWIKTVAGQAEDQVPWN